MKNSKIILSFTAIIFTLLFTSCVQEVFNGKNIKGNKETTSEVREIRNDFTKIEKSGITDLIILNGTQDGRLELEGESNILEYVETKVEGSTLMINTKKGFNLQTRKPVVIKLNAENLNVLSSSGSGDTRTAGVLKGNDFKISQAGSGDMKLEFDLERLTINMAGSGNINLRGKSQELEVSKAGSGDLFAFDLVVETADISSAGSGDTQLKVKHILNISKVGSGDIFYKGQPKIKASSTGSGDIIDKN